MRAAAYQSVYRGGGHARDLAHQVGVPAAALALATAPLGLLSASLLAPALVALVFLAVLAVWDARVTQAPPSMRVGRARFRAEVAALHLVQPLMRLWGRWVAAGEARRGLPAPAPLPGPVIALPGRTLLFPLDRARQDLVSLLVDALRGAGLPVAGGTGWEEYDATVVGSPFVVARLVTSAHPEGSVHVRVGRVLRTGRLAAALVACGLTALASPPTGAALAVVTVAVVARGAWRAGPYVRRVLVRAVA